MIGAKPTSSLSSYLQMVGRVKRPYQGQVDSLLLDHAGNAIRHGLPDRHWEWELTHDGRRKNHTDAGTPVKHCPSCFLVVPSQTMKCPECGYTWEPDSRVERFEIAGELVEGTVEKGEKFERARLERKARLVSIWLDLERTRRQRGYAPGWSVVNYKKSVGAWPTKDIKKCEPAS